MRQHFQKFIESGDPIKISLVTQCSRAAKNARSEAALRN